MFFREATFYFWDFATGFLTLSDEPPTWALASHEQTVSAPPTAPHVTADLQLSDLRI
jgi:hypothetical protein